MCFFLALLLILWGALMFTAERGEWDDALGYYIRPANPVVRLPHRMTLVQATP
jgi:hypothetical protein